MEIALRFLSVPQRRKCATCSVTIPNDGRTQCMFCSRPPELRANRPLHERRLDHLSGHLRVQDRPLLPLLIEPLTINEVAERLGPGHSRSMVRNTWRLISDTLGLRRSQSPALERLRLLRIVAGLEECPLCGLL